MNQHPSPTAPTSMSSPRISESSNERYVESNGYNIQHGVIPSNGYGYSTQYNRGEASFSCPVINVGTTDLAYCSKTSESYMPQLHAAVIPVIASSRGNVVSNYEHPTAVDIIRSDEIDSPFNQDGSGKTEASSQLSAPVS